MFSMRGKNTTPSSLGVSCLKAEFEIFLFYFPNNAMYLEAQSKMEDKDTDFMLVFIAYF